MRLLPSRLPVPSHTVFIPLARLSGDLGGGTLSTLLALDALTSTLGSSGGVLSLVGLLLALGGGLLLLGLLDGLLAGGGTGLGALGAALLDNVEGSTDDGTLVLDGTAGTLLGDFLYSNIRQQPISSCMSHHLVIPQDPPLAVHSKRIPNTLFP